MANTGAGDRTRTLVPLAALVTIVMVATSCSSDPSIRDSGVAADTAATSIPTPDTPPEPRASAGAPAWLVAEAAGAATTFAVGPDAFDRPALVLDAAARLRFEAGDDLFEKRFTAADGLGPDYSGNSCAACHGNNGRPSSPIDGAYLGVGPVVHVSAAGAGPLEAPFALPGYGTRLQTYATDGDAEAQINVLWQPVDGVYDDGTPYRLRRPAVSVVGREGMLAAGAELSLRIPPQVAGPGLLEFVPEADIVAAADPDDADGDGISGEVQWIVDLDGSRRLGRHGWKAENVDLLHQSAAALADDIGIEPDDESVAELAFYMQTLAIPAGRDTDHADVIQGANLFATVGCASCHTPQQHTANTSTPELDDLTIYPFTDLLLHDLGEGLADGRPVYAASGSEWRTAPLWGIGLLTEVNGHMALLHDGRARSIDEAILWHGGEAQASTDAFTALDAADREALVRFVESR